MRTKWLNLILHSSSLIQKTKNSLIASHGLKSVFYVIYLFLLTLFFVLISTPFNLVSHKDKNDVILRQTLSLTFLIPTLVLWFLKLLSVALLIFVFGYSWFSIQFSEDANETVSLKILDLSENNSYPEIDDYFSELDMWPSMKLNISGKLASISYDSVVVSLISSEDDYVRYFIEELDSEGNWNVEKSFRLEEVPVGTYGVEIAGVNTSSLDRTSFIYVESLEFEDPLWFSVVKSLDMFLNWLIILFVGVSIFLTLIII